jgi:hypothetical protein
LTDEAHVGHNAQALNPTLVIETQRVAAFGRR